MEKNPEISQNAAVAKAIDQSEHSAG